MALEDHIPERPKAPPRVKVYFRLTPENKEKLIEVAEAHGLTMTEVVNALISREHSEVCD